MFKTTALNNVGNQYVDKDVPGAIPGTRLEAADRNIIQDELVNLVEGRGLTLDPTGADRDQILEAVNTIEFPSGTIILFGNNAAPTGWTRKTDWQDNAMFCYAATGSIANGGSVDPQSTHTHTGPSHSHSSGTLQFKTLNHKQTISAIYGFNAAGTEQLLIQDQSADTGGANRGKVQTGTPDRFMYTKDGTGSTANAGTGATGPNGAPYYQEVIAATKD